MSAEGEEAPAPAAAGAVSESNVIDTVQLSYLLTPHDLKRLEAYSRNLVRDSSWFLYYDIIVTGV